MSTVEKTPVRVFAVPGEAFFVGAARIAKKSFVRQNIGRYKAIGALRSVPKTLIVEIEEGIRKNETRNHYPIRTY